jgi:hypothetical protein
VDATLSAALEIANVLHQGDYWTLFAVALGSCVAWLGGFDGTTLAAAFAVH